MSPKQLKIPTTLVVLLIIIALVNGFADFYHWYWTMRWFDKPMHFAGGAWLAGFAAWWQFSRNGVAVKKFRSLFAVCVFFALSVGVLWEVYEAVVSFITVGHINALWDTLGDILFDILGSMAVAVIIWWKVKQKQS